MRSPLNSAVAAPTAILLAAIMIGNCGLLPSARADGDPINGTYRATSVGQWAKTNQAFHDQATVTSTWTITSSCSDAQECTGQVRSDQGWSAPLYMHDGTMWYVKRDVPDWERCPDGTTVTGAQTFTFYPAGPDGGQLPGSTTLAGQDKTVGPSGACRVNKWLVVDMPFRLDKFA